MTNCPGLTRIKDQRLPVLKQASPRQTRTVGHLSVIHYVPLSLLSIIDKAQESDALILKYSRFFLMLIYTFTLRFCFYVSLVSMPLSLRRTWCDLFSMLYVVFHMVFHKAAGRRKYHLIIIF